MELAKHTRACLRCKQIKKTQINAELIRTQDNRHEKYWPWQIGIRWILYLWGTYVLAPAAHPHLTRQSHRPLQLKHTGCFPASQRFHVPFHLSTSAPKHSLWPLSSQPFIQLTRVWLSDINSNYISRGSPSGSAHQSKYFCHMPSQKLIIFFGIVSSM